MMSIEMVKCYQKERFENFFKKYYASLKMNAINHISKYNRKMPGRTWDLPAVLTCFGSFDEEGNLDSACRVCYASKNTFLFKNVKQNRLDNMLAWRSVDWVDQMVKELDNDRYFRFFASGDGYDLELWFKIYEIVIRSPHCKFWIPTRMWKFKEFRAIIDRLNKLPNCIVRFSGDSITGQKIEGAYTSTIIKNPVEILENVFVCPASKQDGKCADCRECWSKNCQVVGYPLH